MAGEAISQSQEPNPPVAKRKRSLPGTPDPEAEVVALSPKTLLATNRFLCEVCGKGFQRDQNLQLHRRGHNLPWRLRQRTSAPKKRVYVCPEKSCVHNHPSRALGDLTGIKKHFCRKHGEKKWKCEKCSKRYAVQSDWKAHSKTCGTREYRCDCGTLFSRRDSFITHRAFCDALAEEAARVSAASNISSLTSISNGNNYPFSTAGSNLMMSSGMLQCLPTIFNPVTSDGEAVDHAPRPGLSLWLGHGSNETESTNKINIARTHQPVSMSSLYSNSYSSCSSLLQQDCQLGWIYGNKMASPNSSDLSSSTLPVSRAQGANNNGSESFPASTVPSLYSTQQHHKPKAATDISATALLQKAAQTGVTSSTFLGSFDQIRCHSARMQDCSDQYDKLLLLDAYRSSLETNSGGDLGKSVNDYMESSHPPGGALYQAGSGRMAHHQIDDVGGGETRDFLGVGVQTLCASSISGWY